MHHIKDAPNKDAQKQRCIKIKINQNKDDKNKDTPK